MKSIKAFILYATMSLAVTASATVPTVESHISDKIGEPKIESNIIIPGIPIKQPKTNKPHRVTPRTFIAPTSIQDLMDMSWDVSYEGKLNNNAGTHTGEAKFSYTSGGSLALVLPDCDYNLIIDFDSKTKSLYLYGSYEYAQTSEGYLPRLQPINAIGEPVSPNGINIPFNSETGEFEFPQDFFWALVAYTNDELVGYYWAGTQFTLAMANKTEFSNGKVKYLVKSSHYVHEAEAIGVSDGNFSLDGLDIPDYISYNGEDYPVSSIGENAFLDMAGFKGKLNLGKNIKNIGNSAFSGCSGFTGTLDLPESLISIGNSAFAGCSGFTGSLNFPESLTSIGSSAFWNCSGFTGSLNLPESLTSIQSFIFCDCRGLNGSLNIPANISNIDTYAFASTNFEKVICHRETTPECKTGAFSGARQETLMVPENSITAYMLKAPRSKFKNIYSLEPLSRIEFAEANVVCSLGRSVQLQVNKTPVGAEGEISFRSGNTAVATVDADGVVIGVAKGSTEIIATSGTLTASCIVTVEDPTSTVKRLEPGTADAPNYYVLKAGRGTPFLAYSEDYLTTPSGIETRLHRTNDLTQANVWAVTPGEEEGTLHITAYGTTYGLMGFVNADGPYYGFGAVATVVKPQDIYPVYQADGTVSLCLNSEEGSGNVDGATEYYTLDASNDVTNGSDFCGNWIPNDAGTNWSAYKLDMTYGIDAALSAVKQAVINDAAQTIINNYVSTINEYIANVPWVADELTAGIEALSNLEIDENFEEKITEIYENTIANANDILANIFNDKTLAIKNVRCEDYGSAPYLGIITTDGTADYCGISVLIDPTTSYLFKSVGNGGYTIYNEATKTWLSTSCTPTTNEGDAQTFYPVLHNYAFYGKRFYGLALTLNKEVSGKALNIQSWEGGEVAFYKTNDDGSIWAIVNTNEIDIYKDAIDEYVSKLEPYIVNVPKKAADILKDAIDQIKSLANNDNIRNEAEEIINIALNSANEYLANGINGQNYNIKSLYLDSFITVKNSELDYALSNEEVPKFTFISHDGGGYTLYNEAAEIWLSSSCATTTDESDALVVYPSLCRGVIYSLNSYYGIVLALEDTRMAIDSTITIKATTTYHDILISGRSRNIGSVDGDAIFALVPADTTDPGTSADVVKLRGIVCKVGDSVEVSAVVEPEHASKQTLNWSSSNPEVAAVDADGVVWFNAPGSATVTAECQGHELSLPFVVREVMARALNVFPVEAVGGVGHEFSLLALHEPENTTDKSVTWESSDPEVATVSEDGRVSLAALGSAKITARSGEHTAVCAVTVDDTVGLTEMASSGVVIDIVEGGIIVRNAPVGEMIAVYAVDGKAVNGAVVESDETRLNLATGIYIVKVSPSTVAKVLVK